MDQLHSFTEKRKFIAWIKALSSRSHNADIRVVFGYDPISWSLRATAVHGTERPPWATTELPLPIDVSQAQDIWDSIQHDNLCLFLCLELTCDLIVVAVRNGLWRALDDRYLSYPKNAFTELTYDDAKTLINDSRLWSALCGEVQMFGVGCRLLQRHTTGLGKSSGA